MVEDHNKKKSKNYKDFEGNTVEEAIENALRNLKLTRDKVKIKILTEGQRGLFGMEGVKKSKIRIFILSEDSIIP